MLQQNHRRTRFQERIKIEREFLEPVNERLSKYALLAGMTAAAIDSWQAKLEGSKLTGDISAVASLLREASARARLLSDNSRDVFENQSDQSFGISKLAIMLKERLQQVEI